MLFCCPPNGTLEQAEAGPFSHWGCWLIRLIVGMRDRMRGRMRDLRFILDFMKFEVSEKSLSREWSLSRRASEVLDATY